MRVPKQLEIKDHPKMDEIAFECAAVLICFKNCSLEKHHDSVPSFFPLHHVWLKAELTDFDFVTNKPFLFALTLYVVTPLCPVVP